MKIGKKSSAAVGKGMKNSEKGEEKLSWAGTLDLFLKWLFAEGVNEYWVHAQWLEESGTMMSPTAQ